METKRAKVIMLPTNKADNAILKNGHIFEYYKDRYFTQEYLKQQGSKSFHLYVTTDDEIKGGDWYYNHFENKVFKAELESHGKHKFQKIIATTDKSLNLSQPSQTFIEEYCKLGGINEVLVEYEKVNKRLDIHSFDGESYSYNLKLKVNSHNTITIHPVKDNWNREEVEELCKKAYLDGSLDMYNISRNRKSWTFKGSENSKNWIKQNL